MTEQATEPGGRKRWWVLLADGGRRVTWKMTATDARRAAEAQGLRVERVIPAGSPLTDRGRN